MIPTVMAVALMGLVIGTQPPNTHVDQWERYSFDIPQNWSCTPNNSLPGAFECRKAESAGAGHSNKNAPLFQNTVNFVFWPEAADLRATFDDMKRNQFSFYKDSSIDQEVLLTISGKPAFWSIYRYISFKTKRYNCEGGVQLGQGIVRVSALGILEGDTTFLAEVRQIVESIREIQPSDLNSLAHATLATTTVPPSGGAITSLRFREDLGGHYMMTVPEDWRQEQAAEETTLFAGTTREGVLVRYFAGEDDSGKLFSRALGRLKALSTEVSQQGELIDLTLNGKPAHLGIYRVKISLNGTESSCTSMIGGALVDSYEGGLTFTALIGEADLQASVERLKQMFSSIQPIPSEANLSMAVQNASMGQAGLTSASGSANSVQPPGDQKQIRRQTVHAKDSIIRYCASQEDPVRWSLPIGATFTDDLRMVAPGRLLLGSRKDDLVFPGIDYALVDARTGTVLWRYNRGNKPEAYYEVLSAADNKIVFLINEESNKDVKYTLLAIDAQSGAEQWNQSWVSTGTVQTYPVPGKDLVITSIAKKRDLTVTAVRLSDGKTAWRTDRQQKEDRAAPPIFVDEGDVYIFHKGLEKTSGESGNRLWSRSDIVVDGECAGPKIAGDLLWLTDTRGVLHTLNRSTGATIYKTPLPEAMRYTSICPESSRVYVLGASTLQTLGSDDARFFLGAVSRQDGNLLWTAMLKEPGLSNLVEANGRLYVGTPSSLLAFEAGTGRALFSAKTSDAHAGYPIMISSYEDKIVWIGEFDVVALDPATGRQLYHHKVKPIQEFSSDYLKMALNVAQANFDKIAAQHGKKAGPPDAYGGPVGSAQQLANLQSLASFHSMRAAELSRKVGDQGSQNQMKLARTEVKIERMQAITAIDGQIAILQINAAFDRAIAMANLMFSGWDLYFAMQEDAARRFAEGSLKEFRLFSRPVLSTALASQIGDYFVRPNVKKLAGGDTFLTLTVIHLPSGRRRDTYLSPEYGLHGYWNVVDLSEGIVYHAGIGINPSKYHFSEPYKSAIGMTEAIEGFLIAAPIKIPKGDRPR